MWIRLKIESNEYTKEHIKKQKKTRKTKRNQMRRFHFSLLQEAQTLRVLKPLSFQQLDRPIRLKTRYLIYQCTVCYPLHLLHWHAELFCNVRGTWWNLSSVCRFIFYNSTIDVSGTVHIVVQVLNLARSCEKLWKHCFLQTIWSWPTCRVSLLWQQPS